MVKAKKLLALLLAVIMVVGLVACGKTEEAPEAAGESAAPAATNPPVLDENGEVDIWAPYEETVTLTTGTIIIPIDVGFEEGEDYTNNPWYNRWRDLFNIQVENAWATEGWDDYGTKLNLCIADNDLPDVFWVPDVGTFNQLVESGVAMDITDAFNTYASDAVKGYMEVYPEITATAYKDGRMYAVPQLTYGIIDQPYQLWLRKDWKNELGYEAPETFDELLEVLRLLKKEKGAVFGEKSDLVFMKEMAPAWGAYPTAWIKTANGIEYGGVQPEMKDVLAAFKAMYDEGLLFDEFMVSDEQKNVDMCASGQIGAIIEGCGFDMYFESTLEINGKDSYFEAYAIPTATGETVQYPISFSNNGYVVINSKCEHPEAAIKILNHWPKVVFEGDEDPDVYAELNRVNPVICNAFRVFDPACDYQQHLDIAEALKTGDDSKLKGLGTLQKYEDCLEWLNNGTPDALSAYYQSGDPDVSAYAVSSKILDNGDYFYDVLWGRNPESLTSAGSTLDDLLVQGYTKIIVGEEPLEYFDELVASWKAAGGEQVTNDMNALYN